VARSLHERTTCVCCSLSSRLQAVNWDSAGEPFAGGVSRAAAVTKRDRHPQGARCAQSPRSLARLVAVGKVSLHRIKYSVAAPPD
jgi:hypothetical protein